jgi:hypothetical protein
VGYSVDAGTDQWNCRSQAGSKGDCIGFPAMQNKIALSVEPSKCKRRVSTDII